MLEKTTRLRFSEDGLADRTVRKAAGKAEKAADRADASKEKLEGKPAAKKPSEKLRYGKADTSDAGDSEGKRPRSKAVARSVADPRGDAGCGSKANEGSNVNAGSRASEGSKAGFVGNVDPVGGAGFGSNADPRSGACSGNKADFGNGTTDKARSAGNNKAAAGNRKTAENAQGTGTSKLKSEPSSAAAFKERLRFDDAAHAVKPPHTAGRTAAASVSFGIHRGISENEDDNAGVQAAHQSVEFAEGAAHGAGDLRYANKLRQYNRAARLERNADRLNVEALHRQRMAENQVGSNPISRWKQRQGIKRQYAAAKAGAFRSEKGIKGAAKKAGSAMETAGRIASRHPGALVILLSAAGLAAVLCGVCSFVPAMISGLANGVVGTSYTAEDGDILGAEADYSALEADLREQIGDIESTHPGYDEYRYSLDEVGHNPFELASYLTVLFEDYTRSEVQGALQALISSQYALSLDEETEIRTRTETRTGTRYYTDPETGEAIEEEYEYEVDVEYEYHILNVTLANRGTDAAVRSSGLDEDAMERYDLLMETQGNREDLFGGADFPDPGE